MVRSPQTITTTLAPSVYIGHVKEAGVSFKNASAAGIIYLLNTRLKRGVVSSSNYTLSLDPKERGSFTHAEDGHIWGPWDAISDTAGGVTLEVGVTYHSGESHESLSLRFGI